MQRLYLLFTVPVAEAACGDAAPWPDTVPALQHFRPPLQTAVQKSVYENNVGVNGAIAAQKSAEATPRLRDYIESIRSDLTGLPCANATVDELLSIVRWEYQRIAL
jgi:hypothetical protein